MTPRCLIGAYFEHVDISRRSWVQGDGVLVGVRPPQYDPQLALFQFLALCKERWRMTPQKCDLEVLRAWLMPASAY